MMPLRTALLILIAVATVAFAIGVSLENSDSSTGESSAEAAHVEGGSEATEAAGAEGTESGGEGTHSESSENETVLGIDVEATPFVVLAVVFSLALAAAIYLRPESVELLLFVALVMAAFAALDVREIFHQADESNDGLAFLAGAIAALHAAAAVLAVRLATATRSALAA
jgi:hypothetical protein